MSVCPICGTEMVGGQVVMVNDSAVGEWEESCPNGHFIEEFAYGGYRTFVGRREFLNNACGEAKAIWWARFWWKVSTPLRWLKRRPGGAA